MLLLLAGRLCHGYLKRIAARAAPVRHPNALCKVQPACNKEHMRSIFRSSKTHSLATVSSLPSR